MDDKLSRQAITFDDVLLEPRYSDVVPAEVSVATQLTKRIALSVGLILFVVLAIYMGWITPHGVGRAPG